MLKNVVLNNLLDLRTFCIADLRFADSDFLMIEDLKTSANTYSKNITYNALIQSISFKKSFLKILFRDRVVQYFVETCGLLMNICGLIMKICDLRPGHLINLRICDSGRRPRISICGLCLPASDNIRTKIRQLLSAYIIFSILLTTL